MRRERGGFHWLAGSGVVVVIGGIAIMPGGGGWFYAGCAIVAVGFVMLLIAGLELRRIEGDEAHNSPLPTPIYGPLPLTPTSARVSSALERMAGLDVSDERIFVTVTPQDLMRPYKEKTAVQANAENAVYMKKWLRVEGPLLDCTIRHGQVLVFIALDTSEMQAATLVFDASLAERFTHLPKKRSLIRAEGQIDEIDGHHVVLKNCRLWQ